MQDNLMDFLKSEYKAAGQSPVWTVVLGNKYLVPYPYVRDYQDCEKAFVNDFLDGMRRDYVAYKKRELPVKYLCIDGDENQKVVVPYHLRDKQLSEQNVKNRILKRADKKYLKAVRTSKALAEAYPERPYPTLVGRAYVKEMQAAHREYKLKQAQNNAVYIMKRIGKFLERSAVNVTKNLKNTDVNKLKIKVRRLAVALMLTGAVGGTTYLAYRYQMDKKEQIEKAKKDPLGHIQTFSNCLDAIKTTLAFSENFAEKAFADGVGVMTIGYGTTYYLDENGCGSRQTTPVKKGDTISMAQADEQKERYLRFEILKQIQKNVTVPMDEATMIATCNFAYVVGSNKFKKSQYLQALNRGETGEDLARYLTGYRRQRGLLPRFYFMNSLLKNELKVSDFMNLTAEGCYNLTIRDVCVCQKDGSLKLDEEGYACFRSDNLEENLKKASLNRKSVACHGNSCLKVKNILDESVIEGVCQMEKSKTYKNFAGKNLVSKAR